MHAMMRSVAVVGLACTVLAGCGTKIKVYQYPEFYTEDLKTIAIVPFKSMSDNQHSGAIVSETLARALQQNNTYQVFAHNDLKAMVDQKDLDVFSGTGDASAAAAKFKPGGKVQALMVGDVSTYTCSRSVQHRSEPVYQYDRNGNRIPVGQREYDYTRIEATVAVSAALIRVSDGTQIHATQMETGKAIEEGELPQRDQAECLRAATEQAVAKLVATFAVVPVEVTVAKNAFCMATDQYDNKWNYVTRFTTDDTKAFVVVNLPLPCDRNPFKWTIVRENDRRDLAGCDFKWDRTWSAQNGKGFEFSPAKIAEMGQGPGNYMIKLYSGREVALTQKFTIDASKK